MKRVIILLFISVAILSAQAVSKVGMTAAQFLKIGVGARATGMGEAFVAVANDASALYWNPAGIAEVKSPEFIFVKTNWIADIYHAYFGFAMPIGIMGTIGGSVTYLGMPDMEVRTVYEPNGTGERFSASDVAVTFSYGKFFTDKFSFGVNTKLVSETIYRMNATGVAVDIGLLYRIDFHNIRLGMNFSNFGTKMQLTGENTGFVYHPDPSRGPSTQPHVPAELKTGKYELPMRFQVGLAGYLVEKPNFKVLLAVDAVHPNDNTEYFNVGTEISLLNMLYVRGGYRTIGMRDAEGGLSFGMGVNWRIPGSVMNLKVDYSYTDFGRLKNTHRVTLGTSF